MALLSYSVHFYKRLELELAEHWHYWLEVVKLASGTVNATRHLDVSHNRTGDHAQAHAKRKANGISHHPDAYGAESGGIGDKGFDCKRD